MTATSTSICSPASAADGRVRPVSRSTQVFGGMLEQQRDALRRFHDDLRDMRKLPADAR